MKKDGIESYFGSYERKSPERIKYVTETGIPENLTGFSDTLLKQEVNSKGNPYYIEVKEHNYPKLYEALTEECIFRGIDRPACYISTENENFNLAFAIPKLEAIFFTPETYEKMNKIELRAAVAHEVKHLYSGIATSNEENRMVEKDCDRASIQSTSYKTVQSYIHKAVSIMINKKVPIPVFRNLIQQVHESFPNMIAENFWLRLGENHPSPAERMKTMRQHEQNIISR